MDFQGRAAKLKREQADRARCQAHKVAAEKQAKMQHEGRMRAEEEVRRSVPCCSRVQLACCPWMPCPPASPCIRFIDVARVLSTLLRCMHVAALVGALVLQQMPQCAHFRRQRLAEAARQDELRVQREADAENNRGVVWQGQLRAVPLPESANTKGIHRAADKVLLHPSHLCDGYVTYYRL